MVSCSFVETEAGRLDHMVFGSGKPILCLHGFADSAEMFLGLKGFEVHALSLPYHGKSEWHSDFMLSHLLEVVNQILPQKTFLLMGFSMGGKIALCLATAIPDRIEQLILLAPDGIATHKLYDTVFLGKYFKKFIVKLLDRHPNRVLGLGKWARRGGLISKFVYDFGTNHLNSPSKRRRLLMSWKFLENFRPNLAAFVESMHKKPILLFLGLRDQIVKVETANFFLMKLPQTQVVWLEKGHLLVDAALEELPKHIR